MRRREDLPMSKHSLNLFEGDFGKLRDLHGRLGAGKVIRLLVRGHISRAEERAAQRMPPVPADEAENEDLDKEIV